MKVFAVSSKLFKSTSIGKINPIARSKKVSKVYYITNNHPPELDENVEVIINPVNFPILRIVNRLVLSLKICKENKPDIIYGIFTVPHGILSFFLSKLFGINFGIGLMGGPSEVKYRKILLNKYSSDFIPFSLIIEFISTLALKSANFITVTGSNTKKALVNLGIGKDNIHVRPTAINEINRTTNLSSKSLNLISIGRLVKLKRFDILIYSVYLVKFYYPNIKLKILGSGPEKPQLKKLIRRLFLEKNIDLVGWKSDISSYLNSSGIFVLTSSHEGMPLAALEAMSFKIPAILPNVGDISDFFTDNHNALLLSNVTPVEVAKAIILLNRDKKKFTKIANNGFKEVNSNHTIDAAKLTWNKILSNE